MCGRFTIGEIKDLITRFSIDAPIADMPRPRYNLAPTQDAPIVVRSSPNRLVMMRWGLVPFWAKDIKIGSRMINARAESVAQRPAFRASLKERRCLVPTTGFYEWKAGDGKVPYLARVRDERLFAMAGLYDRWRDLSGREVQSFTIITTAANQLMAQIHDRMPVILSREDEDRYARAAAAGDQSAKDMLVKGNLRFVVNVAKRYQNQGIPLSDLISEGNIGLINAIERYDVDKGYHFISYAVWWIRQAILKAICEKSRMIRLPLNRANELVQIEKARKYVPAGLSEDGEIREIAKMLDMDADHVADLVNVSRDLVSLEAPVFDERDSSVLGDFVENDRYQSPDDHVIEQGLKDDINDVLKTLTEKESEVLQYRFGLNGRRAMSLKEIGDRFNLTKERIRQIEKAALKRLSVPGRTEALEGYVA